MRKYQHLIDAPKRLLDVQYCIRVAKGEIPPSRYALTAVWEEKYVPADEINSAEDAYGHGYSQGFECELGGRAFLPTPPVGLPMAFMPHFCEGVMAGSDNVKQARLMGNHGDGSTDFDPFSELDDHTI